MRMEPWFYLPDRFGIIHPSIRTGRCTSLNKPRIIQSFQYEEFGESMTHRWGMAVDLDRCTGCEACVTACRTENNIRIAGPEQAARGRSIAWIRVERYYEGDFPDVRVKFRPVMCQQCDTAP